MLLSTALKETKLVPGEVWHLEMDSIIAQNLNI